MKMVSSCLMLVLLSLTASMRSSSAAPSDSKLRMLLNRNPLMGTKQEISRANLAEQSDLSRAALVEMLLSDLVENEALEEENFPLSDQPENSHVSLERAVPDGGNHGDGLMMAPRERKAGCKNFFWKTFTSC